MGQFSFLEPDFPLIYESATSAWDTAHPDPRTACFYSRRALELAVNWLYKYDGSLQLPYQDNLSALVHEPTFKALVGEKIFNKIRVIIKLGNQAVHSPRQVSEIDSINSLRELFHFSYWLTRNYGRTSKPEPGLSFNPTELPKTAVPKQTIEQLRALQDGLRERDEKLSVLLKDKNALDEELKKLRAEIAAVKKANINQPDTHDYSEAQTRDVFIDLLLKEAGWSLDKKEDREYEVAGMPNTSGNGFVDYVLWGDDGKPLGIVEAKATRKDPIIGQQQAKLYADCLEAQFGQRPIIFYTNGYEHWIWDDLDYPPRQVQGFYKKSELELLIMRRSTKRSLSKTEINEGIAGRYYQTRAIRRVAETFENDKSRKGLLVMATGSGKTRTTIALIDLLMRCNWVKRVLFLADRVALVNQAINVFKAQLPDTAPVNLVTDRDGEGRVFASTYPTMMGLIDETKEGQRRFCVGHFDLIVIDEAHRSVFKKYRNIFNYFDSLLLGLTATPKDEIDRNTYGLFDLEDDVPTDAYELEEAVSDGYLVPLQAVSVPLKFQREGINYDELSEDEKEAWDEIEWDEEGEPPDRIGAESINSWLFNRDTVDKVLEHLMTRGIKVAGGDRLGKTIVFAKNQDHANYIAERFNANYPHYKGEFARVITFQTTYAQSLIDSFSKPESDPHIAISVDMLDTGIDVPEVVNLVMFKPVRSKTKFWQMVGRGTRKCQDLFGIGEDKELFYLFDYCGNLEFFSAAADKVDAPLPRSINQKRFGKRLELLAELDRTAVKDQPVTIEATALLVKDPETVIEVRHQLAAMLRSEVAAMNLDNFIVRPKRQLVEKFARPESWKKLSEQDVTDLSDEVAGLPTELEPEPEEVKRFDLLVFQLELALLRSEPTLTKLKDRVISLVGLMEEKAAIPIVKERLPLIEEVQGDEWWQDVTVPMLETMRRRLRELVKFIDKQKRQPVYTNFEDEMGDESVVDLPGFGGADNFARFKAKTRAFLLNHKDNIVIHKLRTNKQLTPSDLDELERILIESGTGGTDEIKSAGEESKGLGLFVRSLVGLDREVVKEQLSNFISGETLNANQIEFLDMITDYLTAHGFMDVGSLYESPFTDIAPQGPDSLFTSEQVEGLVAVLEEVYGRAVSSRSA